jgi:hypothetical protein
MYTFVDFTSQIVGQRGVPCTTNKGVSYTNLVCCGLAVTLKIDYYYKEVTVQWTVQESQMLMSIVIPKLYV